MKMKKEVLIKAVSSVIIAIAMIPSVSAQTKTQWVDSLMNRMTVEEKVGQLFMIRAFSKQDPAHIKNVKNQIERYHVGGVCFFQGDPLKQTSLVNDYQRMSDIPLLVSIDGEWGLGMRFPDKAISFPRQITIGAINDNQLIYRMGKEIGRQCRLLGINVNFAPDVDVNNNPKNPVINMRSFGEDRHNVASKAYAYMKGMQDADVHACAKHFPGHGDTDVDSHHDLPVIPHSRARLDSVELYPFQKMIDQGIASVMVAHLQVPVLDDRPDRPTTVSHNTVTGLLRNEMGFDGIIYTDAMEMKGVTKHFDPGMADLEAFLAGNDIILLPSQIEFGYNSILEAVKSGRITQERLNQSVQRILSAKYDLKLHNETRWSNPNNIYQELNSDEAISIKTEIYEKAVTLVKNEDRILPIKNLKQYKYASIALGADRMTPFQQRILSYVDCNNYWLGKKATNEEYLAKIGQLKDRDLVIISLHDMSWYASKDFGLLPEQIQFVNKLSQHTKVLLTMFGTPYALPRFANIPNIILGYEDNDITQDVMAQAIFGVTDITGKIPVTASADFPAGTGIIVPSIKRMGYSIPERVGIESDSLQRIRTLVQKMIDEKAAPGCQVLIAKDNRIVYHEAFGHHTYNKKRKVQKTDIYDVASVTKIMASTISLMKLDDTGAFDIGDTVGQHIPEEDTTNKASIRYEDMLAHVAGLKPWIPFYRETLTDSKYPKPDKEYYRTEPSDSFPIAVSEDLYLRFDYPDTMWRKIFSSELREQRDYRYSDLAFYIASRTVSNLSGEPLDQFAKENFYDPLGLRYTGYNPLERFDTDQIPPTEQDNYFRMSRVQGMVHDMGAAMLGGVSGHAGLFSNAQDLATIMQMLLNKGYYGGYNYLNPETVQKYTKRHWASSRRGIGFDMKELNPDKSLNMSEDASRNTFGHLGFTGTAVFADPDHDIVYVFLANRTFPTMENNKFGKNNYRPDVQSIIYSALIPEYNDFTALSY